MIEQIFEKLLEASPVIKGILTSIEKILADLAQLAETLLKVTATVKSHQDTMVELTMAYSSIISVLNQNLVNDPLFMLNGIDDTELN